MIYHVEEKILQDVRVCMDENRTDTPLVQDRDEDVLSLNEIIRSKILEAVEAVHMAAPYYMLEQGHNFSAAGVYWCDDYRGRPDTCGWVLLPDDFMRLVVYEMSDWERPVYNAITPADVQYRKQSSRVKGIRGTVQRPVCAVAVRPEGRVLEFWSCNSRAASIERAVYIPYPTIDEHDGVDISERCYRAAVCMTAGLVLTTLGEAEQAKQLFEMAKNNLTK